MSTLPLSILSIGYTRGLWNRESTDEIQRLRRYAEGLNRYTVLVNSRTSDRLEELQLAPNFRAIPSGGRTVIGNAWILFRTAGRELASQRYDLIQAQDPAYLGPIALLLGVLHRVPVNVCVYGPNPFDRHWRNVSILNRLLALFGASVVRRVAGVQVDGALTERSMIANGVPANRVFRKPMIPVDVDDFLAIERPRTRTSDSRPVNLVFVGRLSEQKNLPMLFHALVGLRSRVSCDFQVQIVGKGPLETKLKRLVRRLGLGSIVQFTGHLPRQQTIERIEKADVFVLPSFYEGFPRVLVEAAASALPVVTAAVSGSDEMVVHGETGFVVPIGDIDGFRDRLQQLINDEPRRWEMGHRAREHARRRIQEAASPLAQLSIWETICGRASTG